MGRGTSRRRRSVVGTARSGRKEVPAGVGRVVLRGGRGGRRSVDVDGHELVDAHAHNVHRHFNLRQPVGVFNRLRQSLAKAVVPGSVSEVVVEKFSCLCGEEEDELELQGD